MKTFADINKRDFASQVETILHNSKLTDSFSKFSQDIREFNKITNKPNFLKTEDEKKEFIQKVKSHDDYQVVVADKDILKTLIQNNYFEFILPYALSHNDMKEYENIELIGLGFYEDNQDVCK